MRFTSRTWFLLSLLFLVGAVSFWWLGEVRQAERVVTRQSATDAPTNPFPLLTPDAVRTYTQPTLANAIVETVAAATDKKLLHLRNTSASLRELVHSDAALLLRHAYIDTTNGQALAIPAHLQASGEHDSYLVQANGAVDKAFRDSLESAGARIVAYVPNNAFLVRASSAQVSQLRALSRVQAVADYHPYYKLDSFLLSYAVEQRPLPADVRLNVVLYPGERATAESSLAAMGVVTLGEDKSPFGEMLVVQPTLLDIVTLASLGNVQALELHRERVLLNDRTRVRVSVSENTLTNTPNYHGLTGTNVWVNVNDTGVDYLHPDLTNRVYGDVFTTLTDLDGHGTHVAGTIAGNGTGSYALTNLPPGSVEGADFRGMAPQANIFAMPISLITGPLLSDAYLQETAARSNYFSFGRTNALISNNSWGYVGAYEYSFAAASYDAAVRDALPDVPGSQSIIYVFAGGNDGFGNDFGTGGEPGNISAPGTGKNVITVGAIESLRDLTNEVYIAADNTGTNFVTNLVFQASTDSDNEVASFSSRGNVGIGQEADFGRFKPDVVAPGSFIVSARSKDWMDPTNFPSFNVGFYANQTIDPRSQNNYSQFIPDGAAQFVVLLLPNVNSPNPMPDLPIYVAYGRTPTIGDFVNDNSLSLGDDSFIAVPSNGPLTPGDLRYSVGNNTDAEVSFDVITIMVQTNSLGNYFEELKKLNDVLAPYYRYESGTSMAAPVVSGTLALMQEFFERSQQPYSPALMKALLINGARSVNPLYNFQVANPINYQGWGLINLTNSIPTNLFTGVASGWPLQFIDQSPTNALATGEKFVVDLQLTSEFTAQFPLRVTLVWTDPPGNPSAAIKLVNDLDLVVSNKVTGEIYYGNNIPQSTDFTSATPTNSAPVRDAVNNVENVYIRDPLSTDYVISVVGRRVNVNAVTAHPDDIAQDFALVVSAGNHNITNAFTLTVTNANPPLALELPPVKYPTNGLPLMNQRVGANSPLQGGTNSPNNGSVAQWNFYVFTNMFMSNSVYTGLTNGSNVAFVTFVPPNISRPRLEEADVDIYVSRNPALTNLDAAAIAAADKSTNRGGTELVVYTNAPVGADAIYYIGIKSEDQQGGEYNFVTLSSELPFDEDDGNGGRIMRGLPLNVPIPDGSPSKPEATFTFGISTASFQVRRVVVTNSIVHQNIGDLLGNLSHNGRFAVLNNHMLGFDVGTTNFTFAYDDSNSGLVLNSRPTDGPGRLTDFIGEQSSGVWLLTMIDNALSHTGRVSGLTIHLQRNNLEDLDGIDDVVLAGQFNYYFIDLPVDVSEMEVILSQMSGPLNLYVRRGNIPDLQVYDKYAAITPPGGSLTVGTNDVPPVAAGRYFIGVYNPTASSVSFNIRVRLERNLGALFAKDFFGFDNISLVDDARMYASNIVDDARPITDIQVGVRLNHPRSSDLTLHLVSPIGTRVLLAENRGGDIAEGYGINYTNRASISTVLNDGFENATPTNSIPAGNRVSGWVVGSGDVEVFAGGHTGANSLDINGLNGRGSIFTNVVTRGGQDYRVSFAYTKNPGLNLTNGIVPSADLLIDSDLLISVEANITNSLADLQWSTTSAVFRANSPSTRLTFESTSDTEFGVLLDTVLVEEVPQGAGAYSYAVFTENTNLTQMPIKFAPPPFHVDPSSFVLTNRTIFTNGFDLDTPGIYTNGQNFSGWTVSANTVVVRDSSTTPAAHSPSNFVALGAGNPVLSGGIKTSIPTRVGREYFLNFAHRRNPASTGSQPHPIAVYTNGVLSTFVVANPTTWGTTSIVFRAISPVTDFEFRSIANRAAPLLDSVGIVEAPGPRDEYYHPEETLRNFIGEPGAGLWRLEVTDTRVGPQPPFQPLAELLSWRLELTFAPTNFNAIRLTNGIAFSGTIPDGQTRFFLVDVPRNARHATNSIAANNNVSLYFNQNGLPAPDGSSPTDVTLLGNVVAGQSVVSTNGTYQVDGTGAVIPGTISSTPQLIPGQRYFLALHSPFGASDFNIRVDFDALDTNVVGITTLNFGQTIITNIAVTNALHYYQYNVSSNALSATFELYPTNGNVNLYITKASASLTSLPDSSEYMYASENPGANAEIIAINRGSPIPLQTGLWYIGVQNVDNVPVDYAIRVVESTNAPNTGLIVLTPGVPVTVKVAPGSATLDPYFLLSVTNDPTAIRFEVTGLNGDVELLAARGVQPVLTFYDYRSDNAGTNSELINVVVADEIAKGFAGLNDDWYLTAPNKETYEVTFTILATLQTTPVGTIGFIGSPTYDPLTGVTFSWSTVPGNTYEVQSSEDLVTWTPIYTVVATSNTETYTDPVDVLTVPMRFYRIIENP